MPFSLRLGKPRLKSLYGMAIFKKLGDIIQSASLETL
jgi:hypothetical protein